MKKAKAIIPALLIITLIVVSCGGGGNSQQQPAAGEQQNTEEKTEHDAKGIGSIKEVTLNTPLDQSMVTKGKDIYEVKCSACHKLDGTKLVGPGWKNVTQRRKPEWIMNFVTNVDEMLTKDAQAMAMLEECLVRMPNQNLSEDDARGILEFMRKNDGEK
jgi:mono/diheme cytochrome c family protein